MRSGLCCLRCPSVCPSVTLVYCIQTAEDIVKLLSRYGNPNLLVFLTPNVGTQFQGNPFSWSTKINVCGKILRYSTEIAVYIGNGTR